MSIIYKPDAFETSTLPTLGMKVSLGILRALNISNPNIQARIKWPNDIYVERQKLSGILIENALAGTRVLHSIIGIGMNLNESAFPVDIPNAVSLSMLTGQNYDLLQKAKEIRASVLMTLNQPGDQWKTAYDAHIYGIGETHMFEFNGNEIPAEILGVTLEGKILLRTSDGNLLNCFSHEAKWKSPSNI
jgi:BirA family biotin operon repressor/biotin-[acetyl-CoA-carboxylase] ligase